MTYWFQVCSEILARGNDNSWYSITNWYNIYKIITI